MKEADHMEEEMENNVKIKEWRNGGKKERKEGERERHEKHMKEGRKGCQQVRREGMKGENNRIRKKERKMEGEKARKDI